MRKDLIIIFVLIPLVSILQYYLLSNSLTLGFKPDDWILYFTYKALGSNPLSNLPAVWAERGLYTTYQVYYMGLLDSLFSLNYFAFHLSNLILKIVATLGLYPLILIIFKKRLLAVLTVILFSISPSAVGPLEFVVKGSDYLAIIFMEGFLLIYYLLISGKLSGWKYYFLLFIFFIFSFSSSPIRMFPLLVIPLLIESFLILKNLSRNTIKHSLKRLLVLYFPFIAAFIFLSNVSLIGDAYAPARILKKVLEGNLYLILAPFSGIGYLFITNDYVGKIFGLISTDNFRDYLTFILGGPTVILGLITILVSWSLIAKGKLIFIILTSILNFLVQILFFFISTYHFRFSSLNVNYDFTNLYSVIFGGYILTVGVMAFLFSLKHEGSQNKLLASFWVGSAFLFIFTFFTWAFAPLGTGFNSTSYYLVVASIGSSLMTATLLVAVYNKIKYSRIRSLVNLVSLILILILILIFVTGSKEIRLRYSSLNRDGRGAWGQIILQKEARRVLTKYKEGDSALFYFDTSGIVGYGPFYSEGFLVSFPLFMLFQRGKVIDGCIGIIYEDNKMLVLKNSFQVQNGIKGFYYQTLCVKNGKMGVVNLFFTPDNFYALKIKDKKLIDIKEIVLDKLNID